MKVSDNLDRHKTLDKFEFRPDQTIHFGYLPLPINVTFDLVRSGA